MRRIAGQALVRSLGNSLHMARSRRGAKSQADALVRMAQGQMKEVTHEQLLQAKLDLQQALEEKQGLAAANTKLRQDRSGCCISSTHALVLWSLWKPCISPPCKDVYCMPLRRHPKSYLASVDASHCSARS